MVNTILHNQPIRHRFIYFSDGGIRDPKSVKTDELTERSKRQIKQLGLPEEKFRGAVAYDSEILEKLHQNETLRDGTYPKDPRSPHFLLMNALSAGKFPDRGEGILRFLEAIEGGEHERKEALKILKEINGKSGPLTAKQRDKYLNKLDEARVSDTVEDAKKAADKTMGNVERKSAIADTQGRVHAVDEALKPPEKKTFKIGNWEVEPPREGLVEELTALTERYHKASGRYVTAYRECEKTVAQLREPFLDEAKKEQLIAKIHALEQTKATIECDMAAIKKEAEKAKEEYDVWMVKTMKMFRKLEAFLSESGIDLRTATHLKRWLFKKAALKDATTSSAEIGGTVSSPETGLTTKKYGKIEIRRIFFDKLDLTETIPNEGEIKEAIGSLMVEFADEEGEVSTASYINFMRMVDAEEVHEEMAQMEELNERIAQETHYKPLAAGDEFEAKVVEGFDEKGEEKYERRTFTIEKIGNEGGRPVIILDRTVTKTEKERLAKTAHPALYFDRKQREFSPGEFAKFVKQHNFARVLTPSDDLQTIADGAAKHHAKQAKKFNLPREPWKLTLPKAGEPPREVTVYSDKTGEPYRAYLSRDAKDGYSVEILKPDQPQADQDELLARLAAAEGLSIPAPVDNGFRITREEPFGKAGSNLEVLNKGNIVNAGGHGATAGHDVTAGRDTAGRDIAATPGHDPTATATADEYLEALDHPAHGKKKHEEAEKSEEELKGKAARVSKPEALPYGEIYKMGGMSYPERGVLKRMWDDTKFLSFSDIWQLGKAGYDYYQRRWDRRQKDKYATVGEDLPFFGSEFRRIKQAAENEEVHQFHESFAQKGVFEIEERLRATGNKDEMKACIEDLAEKGHMRWDDIDMWKNLNRFVDDPTKLIPIPSNGDAYTRVSATDDRTGLDFLAGAIDSIWGENTHDQWFSKDKSARQSGARQWYEKGKELEIIEGGHEKALENLLRRHRNGGFVDPQEYEGLILHMIEAGKSMMQPKIYYIVAGAAAENHHGHTILSFDRIGHINSEMLANFPLLEYMAASPLRPDGKRHRWTIDDYRRWLAYFEKESGPDLCQATKEVDNFMWRYVIPSYENEARCNKDLRNADKLDHDDMFAYLPPASTNILTNACRTVGGGGKHLLTMEGYANVAPGFSQYIKSLAHFKNMDRFQQAVKSYVRFEAIMMSKWEKDHAGHDDYARMDKNTLTKKTIVSDTPPIVFFRQLNSAVRNIAEAYGDPELLESVDLIQTDTSGWDMRDANDKAKQRRIQMALERFDDTFDKAISVDGGQKAMDIIEKSKLEGMDYEGSHKDYTPERYAPPGTEFSSVEHGHGHGGHGHGGH